MTADVSRLSFDEFKHFLGVHLQAGRVQLDADWNEQSEIWLRLLQRATRDEVGVGSPNDGFRVDDRILLDAMDARTGWTPSVAAGPAPTLHVDYFDHRVGAGALVVAGADTLQRRLARPADLTGLREILVAVKGTFAAGACTFSLWSGGAPTALPTTEVAGGLAGWRLLRADPAAVPANVLAAVEGWGFSALDPARAYRFDSIRADLPIRWTLARVATPHEYVATSPNVADVPEVRLVDDDRIWRSLAVEVTSAGTVAHTFGDVRDLRHTRRLLLAARSDAPGAPAYALRLVDDAPAHNVLALTGTVVATVGAWEVRAFDLPQAGTLDWSRVREVRYAALTTTATYRFSPLLAEASLDGNLVVMGGDGSSEGAGRFYGDGLAAVKERHETYFGQADLPEADPAPLAAPAADTTRVDLAYLDLWERPVTYLEDPEVREIALEGPDTCTRTRLVAQVRVLPGAAVAIGIAPVRPDAALAALPQLGGGTLTTKDLPAAALDPCADPCEPEVVGTFVGAENRLVRVQVWSAGDVGAAGAAGTATLVWSQENGAVATPLLDDAALGSFTAVVEDPSPFAAGDLVELADDLADLITGPYTTRTQTRGELRRITGIDLQARTVSWEDAAAPDPALHAALPRAYRVARRAKIRRWDALIPATPGDIVLTDGIVIELGGAGMLPGDYWSFTTRVADRSVERLIEAPPRGVRHRYFPLAAITRANVGGAQSVVVDDLRAAVRPLSRLDAAHVAFDPGHCAEEDARWTGVETVQEAIETLCATEQDEDIRLHNRLLHGHGVVCGLKVKCDTSRRRVVVEPGYALDCEGNVIRVRREEIYDLVAEAAAAGLLNGAGDGEACLRIRRGAGGVGRFSVEPVLPQTFWQGVLEGTLLKDFFDHCIKPIVDFAQASFLPFPDNTVPVSDKNKLAVSALNLLWQLVNPSSGRYVFLSKAEHDLLQNFYDLLKVLLSSETFCAMFDGDTPFPAYPAAAAMGIDTSFGLFQFHRRVRLHPNGQFAYTCLGGNKIQVHDLTTQEVVQLLTFPGGSNAEVQDVAFRPDGGEMYAVAIQNSQDSIFATATIGAGQTHAWGATTVVCDFLYTTLATSATHPNTLYALARNVGLFAFNPAAIPLVPPPPSPAPMAFNATGLLHVSADGLWAFAGEFSGGGGVSTTFDRVRRINLNNTAAAPVFLPVAGLDVANDIAYANGNVHVTGNPFGPNQKPLFTFVAASGAAVNPVVNLGVNTVTRLEVLPGPNLLLATQADRYRVVRVSLATRLLDVKFRVPAQIMPIGITRSADASAVYVLNYLSNTLTTIDVPVVVTAGSPPAWTAEPPTQLAAYRQQILDAFGDLLSHFVQYLKDCFCDHFLIDCEDCRTRPEVYLGVVEIRGNQVYHICNFSKRHYVKTFRTYGYWLSTVPVLPLAKQLVKKFCCTVF
jgi:DNA-binding beta-propeller fold protein YncE